MRSPTCWGTRGGDGQTRFFSEASTGFEPVMRVLQTLALPLGHVAIWIDNQFLAWSSDGRFDYGDLETVLPAWVEIKEFQMEKW